MSLSSNVSRVGFDVSVFSFGSCINLFQIRLSMFNSWLDSRTNEVNGAVDSPRNQSRLVQRLQCRRHGRDVMPTSLDYRVIFVISGVEF